MESEVLLPGVFSLREVNGRAWFPVQKTTGGAKPGSEAAMPQTLMVAGPRSLSCLKSHFETAFAWLPLVRK